MRINWAVLGLALVAPLAAVPAHAASGPAATQLLLSAAPGTVSYPGAQVTVSGVLETAGTSPQPLANEQVALSFRGSPDVTLRTDASGQFSWTEQLTEPGVFGARFAGDTGYSQSSAGAYVYPDQVYPARIVLDPIPAAGYLATVAVTGTVQLQLPGGSWVPSPGAAVSDQCPAFTQVSTDASGTFQLPVEAEPSATCTITATGGLAWSGDAVTPRVVVPLTAFPTWFCHATGPDVSPSPAGQIGIGTGICYEDSGGGTHSYPGEEARLYFQAPPAGPWQLMATVKTDVNGLAHATVSGFLPGGALAAGNWKWETPGSAQYLSSYAGPFSVLISVPTRQRGTAISWRGRHAALVGTLAYLTRGGPVTGATVVIEHYHHGWQRAGTALTSASGAFRFALNTRLTGSYRVMYRGGRLPGAQAPYGSFLPSRSVVVKLK